MFCKTYILEGNKYFYSLVNRQSDVFEFIKIEVFNKLKTCFSISLFNK